MANGCYTLKTKHSNKFIQPENNNGGARLRQYDGNGQTNQIFSLEWVDNNSYRINSQSASKVVEAAGAGSGNATPVVLGDWNNGNHQKWNVEAWGDGTYKLSPRNAPGKLFDIEGTYVDNGAGVHLWDQHSADNQRFFVQSTSCTSGPPPPPGGCTVNKVRFRFRNVGDCCMDRLQGAKIQGSNDQSNWTTLHTFTENGTGDWQTKDVTSGNFQHVRFVAGPNGYGELHELEFYNGATKLSGTPFGSAGGNGSTGYAAAFDGNTATQWHGASSGSQNVAGLSLTGCEGSCSAPVPGIAGGGNVCNGQTVTLNASGCSGTYRWSNGTNGTASITVGAGTYSVACEQGGCTSGSSQQVTVTANCGGMSTCSVNKIRIYPRKDCCAGRTIGGKVQVSTVGPNGPWEQTPVFTIPGETANTYTDFTFSAANSIKAVRYLSPDGGYGNVAEIEFYNGNTKLTGSFIHDGGGSWNGLPERAADKAVDGNPDTFYDSNNANGAWVGYSLTDCGGGGNGTCTVNKVRFRFRNVGDCCMDRLQGAKIQGSNDQSNWTDLHTFNENGTGDWQTKDFTGGSYQHVRFVAGPNGYGELHELEFYNGTTKLTGTPFGTAGTDGSNGYGAAFDGNIGTQWHAAFPGTNNYAGLSLSCGSGGRQAAEGAYPASTEARGLLLVPNPATDYVELRLSGDEQVRRATCFDALGRKLVETTESRMYVGRLAGGTYLIRVETTTGQVYGKMLVKP